MKPTNSSLSTYSNYASRPTPPEDARRIIEERSPIRWTQNMKAPILILSGEVDEIVPPNQAYLMAEKIQRGAAQ